MYIPEQIRYISRSKEIENNLEYYPTFACDAKKEKSRETGISWATSYRSKDRKYTEIVEDNRPLYNCQIVDLDHRGEGGRAYKVIIWHGFYVDLREDVLLDCIRDRGIAANGYILNGLIWAVLGSQTRLIMYHGDLHKKITAEMVLKSRKPLSKKDLIIGNIYQDNKEQLYMYLGIVDNYHTYRKNPITKWNESKCLDVVLNGLQLWFGIPTYALEKRDIAPKGGWHSFIGNHWYLLNCVKEKKVLEYTGNLKGLICKVNYDFIKDQIRKSRMDGTPKESIERMISWIPKIN